MVKQLEAWFHHRLAELGYAGLEPVFSLGYCQGDGIAFARDGLEGGAPPASSRASQPRAPERGRPSG